LRWSWFLRLRRELFTRARTDPPALEVLRLRFVRDGFGDHVLLASGRYAYVERGLNGSLVTGTLIDDRTGRRTSLVSPAGCYPKLMGGRWLLFSCQAGLNLYSLATGAWRPVPPLPGVSVPSGPASPVPVAVGSSWIEFNTTPCEPDPPHCGNAAYVFESVKSGQVRSDPTSATRFADLNSPALARKVCSPLRVPKANMESEEDLYRWAARPGTITFYGRSVMANGMFRDGSTGLFLERCGSHLHRFIDDNINDPPVVAANSQLVIWQARADRLSGLWLPSLRPFVISLPTAVHSAPNTGSRLYTVDLSSRTLYLVNEYGQFWTARTRSR
jgi:hypothetical protein